MIAIIGAKDKITFIASAIKEKVLSVQHHRDNSAVRISDINGIDDIILDGCEIVEYPEVEND